MGCRECQRNRRAGQELATENLLYANSTGDKNGTLDFRLGRDLRRPHEAASHPNIDFLSYYFLGVLPQPCCRRVAGVVLHRELEKRRRAAIRLRPGLARCGCEGEASSFLDAGNVYV